MYVAITSPYLRDRGVTQSVHDIPGCPGKETQISEIVGAPTLVTNQPRAGESRLSRDFYQCTVELIAEEETYSLYGEEKT